MKKLIFILTLSLLIVLYVGCASSVRSIQNSKIGEVKTTTIGSRDTTTIVILSRQPIRQGVLDTLLLLYPGYKQLVLCEEMKKTQPITKEDSLLAWTKDNFMTQISRNRIVEYPIMIKPLQMPQQYMPMHLLIK